MMNKLAALLLAVSTIGCATESDGALRISGQLEDASRVTHVIATNVETGEQVVVDLKSDGQVDGRFEISMPTGAGSWLVAFADAHKKGVTSLVATLQSAGLDAFPAKVSGALEFGTVTFSGRRAHGTMTWDRLENALGASREWLEDLAKHDDVVLRYSNPDVDADGELDVLQGRAFRLDITGSYRFQTDGRDAEIADLVTGVKAPAIRYTGTTLQAAVPNEMNMNMLTGTMQFDQAFFGTALGENTPMVPAGTRIGQPHIKFGELDGAKQVGVVAAAERNVPNGTYRFGFDNGHLTFIDVITPTAGALMAAHDYSVPFIRIRPTDATCTRECDIGSIDLEWKRATAFGWEKAAAPRDASLDIVAQLNSTTRAFLTANLTDGATSQRWQDMPVAGTGLVRNELSYITTSRLCYIAVSYTSELGIKMTGQVKNPGCF